MIDLLIWLAIIPSAILIYRVLRSDRVESEPAGLLIKVFLLGALSCFPAAILESIGEGVVESLATSPVMASALMFLIIVPCAEEFVKFLAMRTVRKNPAFNYTFDGIVYGVTASLGFATLENLIYVIGFRSLVTAVMRGVLSIPLHCTCGVFMGYYYGLSQWYESHGQASQAKTNRVLTLLVPIIIHGLYDFSLDADNVWVTMCGFIFTIVVFVLATRRVRASSTQDTPFGGVPIHPQVAAPAAYPVAPAQAPLQGGAYPYQAPQPQARPYQQAPQPQDRPYQQVPQPQARPYQQQPDQPTKRPYQPQDQPNKYTK